MRHYLCSVMCTDWFICAWEVVHTGSSPCKTYTGIFSLARRSHHYCYYLFTTVFRNEKQTHIYTQATRAINMKYCLIEDIVLKTLPRAFFRVFLLFVIYLLFSIPQSSGFLIVYTLSRRTLLGTKKKKKKK